MTCVPPSFHRRRAMRVNQPRHRGTKYVRTAAQMRKALRVKRVAIVLGLLLVIVFTLIGILSVTRGTPVQSVIAIGDRNGPPPITDSLFARSMQLYTGLHLTTGNSV